MALVNIIFDSVRFDDCSFTQIMEEMLNFIIGNHFNICVIYFYKVMNAVPEFSVHPRTITSDMCFFFI